MSVDIATLGIAVDSRPVVEGTRALDAFAETSAKVDQKLSAMNSGMNATAAIMRANAEAAKTADDANVRFLANLQREVDLFGANRAETERYNAAAAGMSATTQRAAAALGAKIDAMQREEKAARDAAAAEDQAAKAADRFMKSLNDQVATLGMTTTQLRAYRAAQLGIYDAAAPLIKKLEETGAGAKGASGHMDGFSMSSMGARRELIVLAHEMSQGNFQKFGGSMMVLGEQTGAAGLLFSATGLAVLGLGAAVVGVAAAMIKGAHEQKAMNDALIMTGNYAGTTSDNLNAMAHAATEAGGSIGEAKKAVTELAASGKFTSGQIGLITEAAIAMEHGAGKSVEATIKEFELLAVQTSGNTMRSTEAISRAALKLDDTYHFLTESIYEQIRALEKDGDQKAASALAIDTLANVTKDRAEEMVHNLGYVSRGWNAVKEAIGGAVDAIGSVGKKATPGSELEKYSGQLANFDAATQIRHTREGTDPNTMTKGEELARLEIIKKLTAAVVDKNAADAAAIAQGKATVAQSEAMHAASRVMQDDARLQKKGMTELQIATQEYNADIAKIKAVNPDSPLITDEAVKAHLAALTKAHTATVKGNDDRAKLLQDALTKEQTALDSEKSVYDARDKMLSMYHSKFGMSDADFYAGREVARAEYIASEAVSFAKETALVKASESSARNPQEVAAAKEKYDQLVKAHQKFVDDMRNTGGDDSVSAEAATKKQYDDVIKATHDAGVASIASLDQQILKQREHNAEIGKTKEQIELARQAQVDLATAQLQSDADFLRDGLAKWELDDKSHAVYQIRLNDLDAEIARRRTLADLLGIGAADESRAADAILQQKLANQAIQDWQRAGTSIADSLSVAFGRGGKAAGEMFKAFAEGQAGQLRAQKELAAAKKLSDDNPEKIAAINRAQSDGAQAQLKSYGDMAGAAQSYFDKGSAGYQAMGAAAKVMHAAEVALSLVKGVNAVLTQGEGDPYSAFARMAAMAAIVAGLGVALTGGGGGGVSAADRQKAQGAGTVLGDSSAKSDSIAHSIAMTAANSSTQINYLAGMLTSLQAIQTNIGSFASRVVQNTDLSNPDINLNTNNGGASTLLKSVAGMGIGFVIPAVGNLLGKIATSIFGGKQTLADSGFMLDKTSLASVLSGGVNAKSYADITTSGGWFSSDKTSTQGTVLGADTNKQFGLIISSLADSIKQAGGLLGVSGDDFTAKLNSFVIDIGKVSLKGLTGDEQQKALEAVFSKLGDQMAEWAVAGLGQFAKVGEGYLETLTRVATDYAKLDASLASVGMTFGSVGIASVGARENLIALAGGIDKFQSDTASFAQSFLSKAEQLAPVQKFVDDQLAAMGLSFIKSRDQFKDEALGLDLTTAAGEKEYAALMSLQAAFAATHAATVDLSKTEQEIADERKGLQDQLDQLTMSQVQLLAKQRDALDESNRGLFDQVQAATSAKAAIEQAQASAAAAQADSLKAQAEFNSNLSDFFNKMADVSRTLRSFSDSLQFGALSPLSKGGQYDMLKGELSKAQPQDVQAIASAFLQASKDRNGSNLAYAHDFAMTQQLIGKAAATQDQRALDMASIFRSSIPFMADGSHAGGLGSVPFDGYRAILHKDEGVLTAAENRQYRAPRSAPQASSGMSEATAQRLIAVIEKMEGNTERAEKHARTTANILQRVSRDGKSLITTAN